MHVLQVGLDEKTKLFLKANKIMPHHDGEIENAEDLFEWVRDGFYEAVVIDLDQTGWGSFFPRTFRSQGFTIPIVAISNGTSGLPWSELRATFLENGGDDLLHEPVNPRELAASLRSVTRRFQGSTLDMLTFKYGEAHLRFDRHLQRMFVNDVPIPLTGKELTLLEALCISGDRVQSKEMLLRAAYATYEDEPEIKIIDVFICKIRHKLRDVHPDAEHFVSTVWGRGYALNFEREVVSAPKNTRTSVVAE